MSKHIAVLSGGMSSEREVSLRSGAAVAKALRQKFKKVTEIDVGEDLAQKLLKIRPDVAFIALHGTYGEDGCVQGLLEFLGIPYTHSSVTSAAVAMDKELSNAAFQQAGLVVPKTVYGEINEIKHNVMPLPYVLKPVAEGSSVGVSIIRKKADFERAKKAWKYGRAMVQEFIGGRELSVAVLQNPRPRALGVIELKPKAGFYDYTNKYTDGKTEHLMPAPLTAKQQKTVLEMAELAHKTMKCSGLSRTDFRFDGKKFYILETNTHPGMTELSLAPEIANHAGINFTGLVEILVKNATLHNSRPKV